MKKNKYDFREECMTLPDEELKKIYDKLLKTQDAVSKLPVMLIVPAFLIYGFLGWLSYFGLTLVDMTDFLVILLFAVCGVLMKTRNEKTPVGITVFFVCGCLLKFGLTHSITPLALPMIIYVIGSCVCLNKVINNLNFLRGLPNYPFNNRRTELEFNSMKRDEMCKYLKNINKDGDRVIETNYERIFESDDPEKIVSPPEKKEEYFQQHKSSYKPIAKDKFK